MRERAREKCNEFNSNIWEFAAARQTLLVGVNEQQQAESSPARQTVCCVVAAAADNHHHHHQLGDRFLPISLLFMFNNSNKNCIIKILVGDHLIGKGGALHPPPPTVIV